MWHKKAKTLTGLYNFIDISRLFVAIFTIIVILIIVIVVIIDDIDVNAFRDAVMANQTVNGTKNGIKDWNS